ncbi:TIGR02452 family protein [Paenibacillus sp. GSMTC-2017]|uniref:TIGR02452 family protein n=1 Tax=Paenibacillus sp. GSMTC-2017 TaxID=2794350 RepID=UPI0018D96FB5|nr:TIGR02452 family protein [Paenibacillus sp. GSMTC-2017]MBH5319640.1 TIGR02452 family protein [Paenibacillus sp. GSMTC-2017]
MNRKKIAEDTLRYIHQGYYEHNGKCVDFSGLQRNTEEHSITITPQQGALLVEQLKLPTGLPQAKRSVTNEATVQAILNMDKAGLKNVGVLNFASAKNAGGGFLNGAMAQEESLAASRGLYETQLRNEEYYRVNRATKSMMYTNYAIYSPDVPFIRDARFELMEEVVTASVLTLPAVNYGQVVLKGEDTRLAKRVMKDRMRLALAIFASRGDKNLILGAYGCGVFRNDPIEVAGWWKELLEVEEYGVLFDEIVFAVLDSSKGGLCIGSFLELGRK